MIARLREIAGPRLYAGNAFRLTGLPTDAGRQDVLHRKQQLAAMRQLGLDDRDDRDDVDAGSDEAYAAFDRILGDPRRRLVEELFWLWDTPEPSCGCPASVHRDHDAAVRAHSAALDLPVAGGGSALRVQWEEAAECWTNVLRGSGIWQHLRKRIAALDDRQLTDQAITEIGEELPQALLRPLVQLAAAAPQPGLLADLARSWPAPPQVIEDQLEAAATPFFEEARDQLVEAAELLSSGLERQAADRLANRVMPPLRRMSALAPAVRHRRTTRLRNQVAVAFNNCAARLVEQLPLDATDRAAAKRWFEQAAELASDPQTIEAVTENRRALDQLPLGTGQPYPQYKPDRSGAGCVVPVLFVLGVLIALLLARCDHADAATHAGATGPLALVWLRTQFRQRRHHRAFRIAPPAIDAATRQQLEQVLAAVGGGAPAEPQSQLEEKALAEAATNLWRAQRKLDQSGDAKPTQARQTGRYLQTCRDALTEAGLVVQDHDGDSYHSGRSIEAVLIQPDPALTDEIVLETVRPSIYLHGKRIQMGQVIVGCPPRDSDDPEGPEGVAA